MNTTRRSFLRNSTIIGTGASIVPHMAIAFADQAAPFRTPYKYPKLILSATGRKGDYDLIHWTRTGLVAPRDPASDEAHISPFAEPAWVRPRRPGERV